MGIGMGSAFAAQEKVKGGRQASTRQAEAVTGYFYSPAHWQSAAAWIRLIILFLFFFSPKKGVFILISCLNK